MWNFYGPAIGLNTEIPFLQKQVSYIQLVLSPENSAYSSFNWKKYYILGAGPYDYISCFMFIQIKSTRYLTMLRLLKAWLIRFFTEPSRIKNVMTKLFFLPVQR